MDAAALARWTASPPTLARAALKCCGTAQISLWSIALPTVNSEDTGVEHLLSAEELERADRFHKRRDRASYVVAHGALRFILHHFFGVSFKEQQLDRGPSGKPRLALRSGQPPLYFNLSHSDHLILIAVSGDSEVGVDIESIDTSIDFDVTASFCSPAERRWIFGLCAAERVVALYRLWTIKEAVAKAFGSGLHSDLCNMSVDLSSKHPRIEYGNVPLPHLSVRELHIAPGYAAALASFRHDASVHHSRISLRKVQS